MLVCNANLNTNFRWPMAERTIVGDDYVLATGTAGAARLALVQQVYGPDAERIIAGIGIPEGSRIADVGCGTGNVARWFARQTGTTGEVVALDVSAAQLAVARQEAKRERLENIRFIEGDAYATGLPRESFDIVHCRLVLCHLRRPIEALREMAALARRLGRLLRP